MISYIKYVVQVCFWIVVQSGSLCIATSLSMPSDSAQTRYWYIALDDESEARVAKATGPYLAKAGSSHSVRNPTHHVTLLHMVEDSTENEDVDRELKVWHRCSASSLPPPPHTPNTAHCLLGSVLTLCATPPKRVPDW